ncbi:MAG: hypothetical protein N4A35_15060 [Flavobacteriales bacterium]|jgi:alpha-tubulin suppressor-like RCC1 family protein|nr:hypothetical protein [Flavobacteriales bacterium]
MRKLLLSIFVISSSYTFSQSVGINTATPNPMAALDIESTDKGILIPRMTTVQRNSLGTSLGTLHESLMVYDVDDSQFYFWDGTAWSAIGTGTGGDDWGAQTVVTTGTNISGNGTIASPLSVDVNLDNDPTNEMELPTSAINGQVATWDGTSWVAQNPGSGADNWGAQTVVTTGTNISGNGTIGSPLSVAINLDNDPNNEIELPASAINGQVLTWNGTSWVAQNPVSGADNWGTDVVNVSGSNISGNGTVGSPIVVTDGDSDPNNEIELPATANNGQVLTWNGTGWVAQNSVAGADNWGTDVVNTSGSNISGDGTSGSPLTVTEVDGDVTNEIQNLTLTGNTLSISGANSVTLPSGADNWGTDVVNTSGSNISGNGTSGSPLTVTEVDGDVTNEIQNLTLTGNTLSISGANSVTLPSGADNWGTDVVNTSGSNISGNGTSGSPLTVTEVDGSVTNEIQNLTLTGNTLSISGANSVTLTDTDPTNELQDISLNGTNLSITSGSTIDLSSIGSGGNSNTANTTPTVGASGVQMIKLVEAQCQNDILGTAYIGADDNIWAHGHGAQYQYGVPGLTDNSFQPHIEPVDPVNGDRRGKWKHVFTDRNTLWAITDSGEVYRRGQDYNGQLGNGTGAGALLYLTKMAYFENNNIRVKYLYISPTTPNTNEGKAVYALTDNGDVYAWGRNGVGQLGIGNTTDQQTPLIITTLQGRNIVKMTQSGGGGTGVSVAAISATGSLYTWGYNGYGQLGTGSTSNFNSPQFISGITAQDIVMRRWSYGSTLLINAAGNVLGAGYNGLGVIGDGTTTNRNTFTQTSNVFTNAKEVHMGVNNHAAAIVTNSGDLYVAGYNAHYGLGLGTVGTTVTNYTMPSAPFQGMVKKVVLQAWGSYKSIHVLDTLGRIWACGDNVGGQLGTGGTHDADPNGLFARAMDELSGAVKFVDIQPIGHYRNDYMSMVALTEDGRVMTTGAPHYGQLGNGTNNAQGPWHRYYKLINFQ